ncbi:MAG: AMP-binding protein, partial [Promethearchaeota archaeon]
MTRVSTIPNKIPNKFLKQIRAKRYDKAILYTLGIFGPHKLEELINNPIKSINDRLDKELFLQTSKDLIEKNLIESISEENEIYYKITVKGEEELLRLMENTLILKRVTDLFSFILGPIEKDNKINVSSFSGYRLSYKEIIFGLLSIHWRINSFIEAAQEYGEIGPEKNISLGKIIEVNANQFPQNIAIKYEDREYTYQQFNEWVNKYANHFISLGIQQGEVINVMLENRPEILFVIAAMSKIGAIASLINTRQRAATLTHSLTINDVRFYVIGEELFGAFQEVKSNLNLNEKHKLFFVVDRGEKSIPEGYIDLIEATSNQNSDNPSSTL